MSVETGVRAWIEGWSRGWAAADPEPIGKLYAEGAVFRSHPFRVPHLGPAGASEYARTAFAEEETVEFRFGEPLVGADGAAVEYWAILRADGREHTLFGVALLRFDDDGLVVSQRDYWSLEEGRREPWEGWASYGASE